MYPAAGRLSLQAQLALLPAHPSAIDQSLGMLCGRGEAIAAVHKRIRENGFLTRKIPTA